MNKSIKESDNIQSKFPELAKEWHTTLNNTTPDQVTYGSNIKRYWECIKCGYGSNGEWQATPTRRTRKGYETGCPSCGYHWNDEKLHELSKHHVIQGKNDLETWCKQNEEWGQQLINEWTGITKSSKYIKMSENRYGSKKEVLWKCNRNHQWYAAICNRTLHKSNCPYCNTTGTSYPEQFIYYAIKQIYPDTINRYKTPIEDIEFDIAIPPCTDTNNQAVCIEYSPTYWHDYRMKQDKIKQQLCQKQNVRLINIIEDSYNELEHTFSTDYICFKMDYSKQNEILIKIVEYILGTLNHNISELNINIISDMAYKRSKGEIEYNKSIEYLYPNLTIEWNTIKNNENKPCNFSQGSNYKAWWQCPNCDHEWKAVIANRIRHHQGCPLCNYNWYKEQIGEPQKLKKDVYKNGIEDQYPYLIKEWDITKNIKQPNEFTHGSYYKAWWKCIHCGNEWQVAICYRTHDKTGCPQCGYNWYKEQTGQRQKLKAIKEKLDFPCKELIEEWHPILNGNNIINQFTHGSGYKAWWLCSNCGNEWQSTIYTRTSNKQGCKNCGYNWYKAQIGEPQKLKTNYTNYKEQSVKMLPPTRTE